MNPINLVAELTATIIDAFLFLYFPTAFFGFKKSIKTNIVIFLSGIFIFVAAVLILNNFFIFENFAIFIYVLICFIYSFIALNGKWYNKILISIVIISISLTVALLTNAISAILTDLPSDTLLTARDTTRIISLILNKFMFFLILKLIMILLKKHNANLHKSEWLAIIFIFIVTVLVGVFIFEAQLNYKSEFKSIFFLSATICLVLINIVSFYMIIRISKEHKNNIKLSILELQVEEQAKNIENINKYSKEIRKIKHDINNHFGCLLELLKSENYQQAITYLSDLLESKIEILTLVNTNHEVLNAILNYEIKKCKEIGIVVKYEVLECHLEKFQQVDICIIITNLLNNAREACIRQETNQINLKIYENRNYLIIQVINDIKISVLKNNPKLLTTKKDKTNHGLGINNINDIVQKYYGMVNYYEKVNTFIADIWIKYPI